MRTSITFIISLLLAVVVSAVPVKRQRLRLPLANGDSIFVTYTGDEYAHWYQADDGNRYEWDGVQLKPYTCVAGTAQQARMRSAASLRSADDLLRKEPFAGSYRGLVILVEFPNCRFSDMGTRQEYDAMYNEVGYNHFDHIGSVHDYFYDQSYGQLDLQFDVVGPVMMSNGYEYYGANRSNGADMRIGTMVSEACRAIDGEVDFSRYDWTGNGKVEQIFIVFAGIGENYAASTSDCIYPVQTSLATTCTLNNDGTGAITLDGVRVDAFACTCEQCGMSDKIAGIGTACHEFSHCFGLPDVYDVVGGSAVAMNGWSVLDCGNYNGPDGHGEVPAPYTAMEKMLMGWLQPHELVRPQYVTSLQCLQDTAEAYIIYNNDDRREFFLLENRQHRRWDSHTGGTDSHGMLVTHIFYDEAKWDANVINIDPKRQCYTYIPADSRYGTEGGIFRPSKQDYDGDLFPGALHRTQLTDTSAPPFLCYTADSAGVKLMHKPITDIAETADGNISFTFMGGVDFDTPQPLPATQVSDCSFTANWHPVDGATGYELLVWRKATDDVQVPFREWEGRALSDYNGYLQVGTSSAQSGELLSPYFRAEGDVTVGFDAKLYRASDTKAVAITLTTENGRQLASETCILSSTEEYYQFTFAGVNDNVRISIAPAKRALFSSVHISYGVTADQQTVPVTADESLAADGGTASHQVDNLMPDSRYVYRIRAIGSLGITPWSAPVEAETLSVDAVPVPEVAGL